MLSFSRFSNLKENTILHKPSARLLAASAGILLSTLACGAQAPGTTPAATTTLAEALLPDAPSATRSSSLQDAEGQQPSRLPTIPFPEVARKYSTRIKPGQTAVPLNVGDKFKMSLRQQFRLSPLASMVGAAGVSHLTDSRPHYGTDSAGFGERVGAAALRQTSQTIFQYGVFASVFHDDPRFYMLGPQYTFKHRVLYAASRAVVTRKDNGSQAPNWALMSAIASSTALTNAYYPDRDRNVQRSITGALTSLAARAASNQIDEFRDEIRKRLHLKH